MTTAPDGTRHHALAVGSAFALGTAVLWITITAWSGKTYHLAPSMDLMVSSHTVAAETCTPCADVMAFRA